MIIPLNIGIVAGSKRPYLDFVLRAHGCRNILRAKAVIDTGSPYYLVLSFKEAFRLQFPFKRSQAKEVIPIGGGKIEAHEIKNPSIWIKDSENKALVLKPQSVYISIPTSKKEERQEETYSMPNLIGVDFLEKNNLKFVFNPVKNEAYLESND